MELYKSLWEPRAEQHDNERHQQNLEEALDDPSCPICYPINEEEVMEKFRIFWRYYQRICSTITYNVKTIGLFNQLLVIWDRNVPENPERNEKHGKICE